MKSITKEMLKIYVPVSNLDWLNYSIINKDLTYHHIIKKCDGGKESFDNGAILMAIGHQYLHLIEHIDIDTYICINKIFLIINKQQCEPTKDQREILEYILRDFEYKHRDDVNSKGKIMIKDKYKTRATL